MINGTLKYLIRYRWLIVAWLTLIVLQATKPTVFITLYKAAYNFYPSPVLYSDWDLYVMVVKLSVQGGMKAVVVLSWLLIEIVALAVPLCFYYQYRRQRYIRSKMPQYSDRDNMTNT